MAKRAAKRGGRTEPLSLRLDPKDKFILDYICRVSGMGITTVIERAIQNFANTALSGAPAWDRFWHVSEGVRTLRMLMSQSVPTTYDEDEIIQFVYRYAEFFFILPEVERLEDGNIGVSIEPGKTLDRPDFIEVLWPNIRDYIEISKGEKEPLLNLVEYAMTGDLIEAGINPPGDWREKKRSYDNFMNN